MVWQVEVAWQDKVLGWSRFIQEGVSANWEFFCVWPWLLLPGSTSYQVLKGAAPRLEPSSMLPLAGCILYICGWEVQSKLKPAPSGEFGWKGTILGVESGFRVLGCLIALAILAVRVWIRHIKSRHWSQGSIHTHPKVQTQAMAWRLSHDIIMISFPSSATCCVIRGFIFLKIRWDLYTYTFHNKQKHKIKRDTFCSCLHWIPPELSIECCILLVCFVLGMHVMQLTDVFKKLKHPCAFPSVLLDLQILLPQG